MEPEAGQLVPLAPTARHASRKRQLVAPQDLARALQPGSTTLTPLLEATTAEEKWEATDSGSSESFALVAPRGLTRRVQQLEYHHGSRRRALLAQGGSFLEMESVGLQSQTAYKRVLEIFERAQGPMDLRSISATELDAKLVSYADKLFFGGQGPHVGLQLWAALGWAHPRFGRLGMDRLPRISRALKGWQRRCPPRSRTPLSWPMVAAIAVCLTRDRQVQMAVWVLLTFAAYLRPSECMGLLSEDLVPPTRNITGFWTLIVCPQEREARTKTGAADDSVLLDSEQLLWLGDLLAVLADRPRGRKVWDFTYPELVVQFRRAASLAGVAAVPYQLRHSGPSWDRLKNLRSLEEIQKRGRWVSFASVRRYEKHGQVAKAASSTPVAVRSYHDHCTMVLEDVVRGRTGCPLPPQL